MRPEREENRIDNDMDINPEMARDIERLNQEWDALVLGAGRTTGAPDPVLAAFHALDRAAGPDPRFADDLWGDLRTLPVVLPARRKGGGYVLSLSAAGLAVLLLAGALLVTILARDGGSPEDQAPVLGINPPTATGVSGTTPTAPTENTPNLAVTDPTTQPNEAKVTPSNDVESDSTATLEVTPTLAPDATVPTGPTPLVQAGGGPYYDTLTQMVNASDIVVVARTTGEVVQEGGDAPVFRAVDVVRTLRGEAPERAYVVDHSYLQSSGDGEYVLFLDRDESGPDDAYGTIAGFGVFPLMDGVIAEPEGGLGTAARLEYAGQPVDVLATDIAAIPRIEPGIERLLSKYGWTSLGKQGLWPRTLPERDGFNRSRTIPSAPYSFEAALEASERIGLDFAPLAGQDGQFLVYAVERNPYQPWVRPVLAVFLIHEQEVAGAWVVVNGAERPFGLDERDAALAIPEFIPTPAPTPTVAVPTDETINPAELYRLADTDTFTFCWPYCDEEPKTVALRDAIVAALDRKLTLQPLNVRPTPTVAGELEPSDGSFVQIVFGYLTPGWSAHVFGYNRESQLVLLPNNAGWVPAPPELIEIMAGIEPPLPTTKGKP